MSLFLDFKHPVKLGFKYEMCDILANNILPWWELLLVNLTGLSWVKSFLVKILSKQENKKHLISLIAVYLYRTTKDVNNYFIFEVPDLH